MSRRGRRRYGGDEADADGFTRGFDMVFNVPGAPGDSELEGHNQWINVLAWSWGLSRGDNDRKKPARILNAIAAKKKEIVNQAMQAIKQKKQAEAAKKKAIKTTPPDNADGNGQVEKKIEETLNKQINGSADNVQHESGAQAPAAVADDSGDDIEPLNEHEIAEEALADYDSDNDDDNQFDESEVKPRSRTKPNMQNLSLTKYVDIASPLLMLKCLSKEPAFDCTLRICKRREVKKPKSESDAKSELADVKEKSDKKHALADGDSSDGDAKTDDTKEEEKKEFESVVVQELLLQDCYIGSVSTGGSGGEDRLTENITINFSRVVFSYTDHLGFAPRGARGEIPTKTVYYDSLRHKAMALDQAVANAIEEQRKLAPVSTVLLDYLNLRSKPNTATQ